MDHYLNLVLLLQTCQTSSSFSNGIQLFFPFKFELRLHGDTWWHHKENVIFQWFTRQTCIYRCNVLLCKSTPMASVASIATFSRSNSWGVLCLSPFLCSEQKMFFVGQISANYFWFFFLHESVCSWADLVWPVLHAQLIERYFFPFHAKLQASTALTAKHSLSVIFQLAVYLNTFKCTHTHTRLCNAVSAWRKPFCNEVNPSAFLYLIMHLTE